MFFVRRYMLSARHSINLFLKIVKWPVALMMIAVVPAAVQTFYRYYVIRSQLNMHNLLYFAAGIAFFAAVRVMFIMKRGQTETMEHEMTHVLFAMATFHPVSKIELNEGGGGSMSFSGEGNWLIALAPYFVPLAAFTMMIMTWCVGHVIGYLPDWAYIGMGAALSYNMCSFAEQLHPRQTDFKVAGYLFTILFLPGANCLSFGMLFAFAERGWNGIAFFYRLIWYYASHDVMQLWHMVF